MKLPGLRTKPPRPGAKPAHNGARVNGHEPTKAELKKAHREKVKEQALEVPIAAVGWLDERQWQLQIRLREASRPEAIERSRGTKWKWRSNDPATPSTASCSMRSRLAGGRRRAGAARRTSRSGRSGGKARRRARSETQK